MTDFRPRCPDCGRAMHLKKSTLHRYPSGLKRMYWICGKRGCDIRISAHPNGKPVGIPVRKELRELRSQLHKMLNTVWNYNNQKEREEMYAWLKSQSPAGHIGKMGEKELLFIEKKIKEKFKEEVMWDLSHWYKKDLPLWKRSVLWLNHVVSKAWKQVRKQVSDIQR